MLRLISNRVERFAVVVVMLFAALLIAQRSVTPSTVPAPTRLLHGSNGLNSLNRLNGLRIKESYGRLSLYFIRNNGQLDKRVQFYEKGTGHSTYFTNDGIYLLLTYQEGPWDNNARGRGLMEQPPHYCPTVVQSDAKTEAVLLRHQAKKGATLPSLCSTVQLSNSWRDNSDARPSLRHKLIKLIPPLP